MGTFGDRLRREREMRGVTLEEIAHSTKIGSRNLRALENEEFHLLPGGIFNRGFVRAYAHFLGLDEEQCVADYNAAVLEKEGPSPSPEELLAQQESQRQPWWKDFFSFLPGDYRLTPLLILLGAVAALLIGGWLSMKVYKGLHTEPEPVNAATRPDISSVQPTPTMNEAEPVNRPEALLGSSHNGPISVAIHLKDECWVSVDADGKSVISRNLASGTEQQFSAEKSMKIVVGDVSAVDVSYNGKRVTLRGGAGKPATLAFTPTGYTQVRSL